ncbi:MAG: hypothetical protein ACLTBV_32885 [Enterocloster bolteae]
MDRVSQAVKELVEEIQGMPEAPDPAETDRHAFTLLLNGIAACRRGAGNTVPHGGTGPFTGVG